MKARGKNLVHVFMSALMVCLLLLSCVAYAAPAATQKSTQQVQPAAGAASSLLNPNAPPQGSITITSPQSGATLYTGMYYPIQWTCNGTRSNLVDVTLWQNNRQTATIWTAVDTGRTAYIIPLGTAEGSYEVRVTSEGDTRVEARLPVTIVTTSVRLTNPPANIVTGSSYTITWSYTGNLSSMTLSTLDSSGKVVQSVPNIPIGSNGTGSLSWTAPALPAGRTSAQYCFQFSALLPTSVTSSTRADTLLARTEQFTISRGIITVASPAKNEVLNMGQDYTIKWTYQGQLTKFQVEYRDDQGCDQTIQNTYNQFGGPKIVLADGKGSVVWTVQSLCNTNPSFAQIDVISFLDGGASIVASSDKFSMTCAKSRCYGICTDLMSDLLNCGWCGHNCTDEAATSCSGGKCLCGAGRTECSDKAVRGGLSCVDLRSNSSNCGACGRKCDPWSVAPDCVNGNCGCGPPHTLCLLVNTASLVCTTLQTDANNCGKCGNKCPTNQPWCNNGYCQANQPGLPADLNTVLPSPI